MLILFWFMSFFFFANDPPPPDWCDPFYWPDECIPFPPIQPPGE